MCRIEAAMEDATNGMMDRMQLAALVGGFAFRDQQRWEELAALFMPGAQLSISWFRGRVEDFIRASREQARSGKISVKHHLGSPRLTVNGDRALGDTDVTILIRAPVGPDEVLVDVTSFALFSDKFERIGAIWKISERTAIYEKDRADPVDPGNRIPCAASRDEFASIPAEYRSLALVMREAGIQVMSDALTHGSGRACRLLIPKCGEPVPRDNQDKNLRQSG